MTSTDSAGSEESPHGDRPDGRPRRRRKHKPRSQRPRRHDRETSAGGLVVAGLDGPPEEFRAALIGRLDKAGRMRWSMPKGHIEPGETAEQAAVREVKEETGIDGAVLASLGSIDYWLHGQGKRVLKTVHHYLMRFQSGELSDEDVEVTEVAWVPLSELPTRLSYADERKLAAIANNLIEGMRASSDGSPSS
ncbi:MAG: NUDIX hydrolase [Segniliparus sp.]|uniref:NUDIX hydrolase n=1 Tax=Segniliparus sp. TaxID=2804064 RepID=UPI003F2C02B0